MEKSEVCVYNIGYKILDQPVIYSRDQNRKQMMKYVMIYRYTPDSFYKCRS